MVGLQQEPAAPEAHAPLVEQWRAFVSRGACRAERLRRVTLQAWARCRDLGVDPTHLRYVFLSDAELAAKRAANARLIDAAAPYLAHLSAALGDRAHCVALSDAEGWILELLEQPENAFGGRATGICVGSSWNERHIGNNGIGTALALGEPTFVYGVEHYAMQFHSAHCLGVPIRADGRIVGCLDVSVTRPEDADPAYMALAQACVSTIEGALGGMTALDTRARALERLAAMGGLLATTLHDLRNPLSVVRAISHLGALTAKGPEEAAHFQKIGVQVDVLAGMLDQIQKSTCPTPVIASPMAAVRETLEEVEPVCRTQGVRLETSLAGEARCRMQPALLKRAIHNLLGNALKAMPSGGTLRVAARVDGDRMRLEVSDTGPGIPDDIQATVFEPFVTGRPDGTGLGLYMVRQTIERDHDGRVWFESRPGRGTTFHVELPTVPAAEPVPHPA